MAFAGDFSTQIAAGPGMARPQEDAAA